MNRDMCTLVVMKELEHAAEMMGVLFYDIGVDIAIGREHDDNCHLCESWKHINDAIKHMRMELERLENEI